MDVYIVKYKQLKGFYYEQCIEIFEEEEDYLHLKRMLTMSLQKTKDVECYKGKLEEIK